MKYYGNFTSINDISYSIEIETKSGTGAKELVFGDSPFTTEMTSESDQLYEPVRTTGAVIEIVTDDILFNLYSGRAKDVKVKLTNTNTNKLEWIGYLQPALYSQGFDYIIDTIQLECIDGLSVLQYLPYRIIGSKPDIKPFIDIIFKCLKSAEVFNYLYISDNVQLKSATANDSICEIFRVSESNFFKEKDDDNQSLDDLAWNCLDVLTEICRFLGYTITADGDSVYIIDYDAIKRNKNTYWKYNISGSNYSGKTYVTISSSKYISTIEDYSDSGNSISLSDVYNKVTVKDDFYTYDSPIISFEEDDTETPVTTYQYASDFKLLPSKYKDYYLICDVIQDRNGEYYEIFVGKSWNNKWWVCIFKFYSSRMYTYQLYNYNVNPPVKISGLKSERGFDDLINYDGASKVKWFKKQITSKKYNAWISNYPSNWQNTYNNQQRHDVWKALLDIDPTTINFKPMLVLINNPTNHIGPGGIRTTGSYTPTNNEDCRKYPYISLNSGYSSASIFGGEGSYIIIKGTIRQHSKWQSPYPLDDGKDNKDLNRRDDEKYNCEFFMWCRLKWGDAYWSGDGWVNSATDFKLYYGEGNANDPMKRDDKYTVKVKEYYDKDLKIKDTARTDYACDDEGYYIPAPEGRNLQGNAEFIIYGNRDMWGCSDHGHWNGDSGGNKYSRYWNHCQFISDFQIKTHKAASDLTGESDDSETIYYNIIDSDNIIEGPEISFKICTYDNKQATYSMVDYLDSNNNSQFVEFTYNKALNAEQKLSSTTGFSSVVAWLRQEEHLVYKIVTQYETPRSILELNLKNEQYKLYGLYTDKTISGKKFVPMTISTDYKYNKQSVKLIEKA